jgi:hypothetical protein
MDISIKSLSNQARFQSDNGQMNERKVNVDHSKFFPQAPNIDGRIGDLLDGLLTTITGSSNAYADDTPSQATPESKPPQAPSRYTGNTCDSNGAVKSIAENGLAGGAGGLVLGTVTGFAGGGPFGAIIGAAAVGAAGGMLTGTVGGGTLHQLGCN